MRFTITRRELLAGVSLVQRTAGSVNFMPILSHILIDAGPGGVGLCASDLESFARVSLEGRVDAPGRVTVPAKTLGDIAKLLSDEDVEISAEGNKVTVVCGFDSYTLAGTDAADFPDWPSPKFGAAVTLRQADFKRQIRSTIWSVPAKDPRRVLMGALIELSPKGVLCTGTNGRTLGHSAIETVEVKGADSARAVIHRGTLDEVEKALGGEGEMVLEFGARQVAFTIGKLTLITAVIEGNFPDYRNVVPDSFKKEIDLPRIAFDKAIQKAGILSELKFNSIVLSFGAGSVGVESSSAEAGAYKGRVEVAYSGEPFKIAFSHQYIHEVFRLAPDDIVRMKVKDAAAPVVFECASDPNSFYLVMPVRMADLEEEEESEEESEELETAD